MMVSFETRRSPTLGRSQRSSADHPVPPLLILEEAQHCANEINELVRQQLMDSTGGTLLGGESHSILREWQRRNALLLPRLPRASLQEASCWYEGVAASAGGLGRIMMMLILCLEETHLVQRFTFYETPLHNLSHLCWHNA